MTTTGIPLAECTLADAAWHPDPYPFYAGLREGHRPTGIFKDEASGTWVACTAEAVADALAEPRLQVRPPGEPVPRSLAGRPAGRIFGELMRMNEGERHAVPKADIGPRLQALSARAPAAARHACTEGLRPGERPLQDLLFEAPLATLASLAGLAREEWRRHVDEVRSLVASWSPSADEPAREAGDLAALALLKRLQGDCQRVGWFTQACDATAALLGTALLRTGAEAAREGPPDSLVSQVAEIARRDPPVQNTRRWAAVPMNWRGADLPAGAPVLVLLASAEHDQPCGWPYGAARHACPGQALSQAIVAGLLKAWAEAGAWPRGLRADGHLPCPNVRIPRLLEAGVSP